MAEEHRCQTSESHHLCANNCGFFGSPATMNLCSKCYRDICLKEQQQASIKSAVESSLSSPSPSSSSSPSPGTRSISFPVSADVSAVDIPARDVPAVEQLPVKNQPSLCWVCRKRVGLTGFKCRCGTTFCGVHRYPEKHGCSFDFKTMGREEIAKANPVVKADKVEMI